MDVTIFLASSSELKEDRNNFQIFINQLNEDWDNRGICFHLKMWEDFIDSMAQAGLQAQYNEAATKCEIFLMLFFTKVGKYTALEFESAFKQFEANNKPRIYTYFKEDYILTGQIGEDIISMIEFKKKLGELNHYVSTYASIEDLKWKFSRQLEKIYGNTLSGNFDISNLTDKSQIDSLAIESVCKLLSPNSDDGIISELRLPELIDKASEFGKTAVFQLAKVNRRSNRNSDRKQMARSIPIFEALIETNIRKDRHYYFGQMGYALKDQEKSDWKNAEENFNIAIDIRGPNKPEYFYEFNRAVCKVYNNSNGSISKPSDAKLQQMIMEDLKYAKKGIGNQLNDLVQEIDNKILLKWLTINNFNLKDL